MAKRTYIDFQNIKASVSIEQALEAYRVGKLKCSGNQLRGPCPIHQGGNDRQFVVWPNEGTWRCFGDCKKSGDVIQLVAMVLGVSNFEAAHDIARRFELITTPSPNTTKHTAPKGEVRQGEAPEKTGDVCVEPVKEAADPDTAADTDEPGNVAPPNLKPLSYLKPDHESLAARGIKPETAQLFGAGFASKGTMAGRVAIPIHSCDGKDLLAYIGAATRDNQSTWRFPKDFRPELEVFNVHRLGKLGKDEIASPLYIAFDPFFVMAQYQDGNPHAVAILNDIVTDQQLQTIAEAITANGYRTLIVAVEERDARALRIFDHFASTNVVGNIMLLALGRT